MTPAIRGITIALVALFALLVLIGVVGLAMMDGATLPRALLMGGGAAATAIGVGVSTLKYFKS